MNPETQGARARDEADARRGIGRWGFDEDLVEAAAAEGWAHARAIAWPPAGAPPLAIVIGRGGKPELEIDLDAARVDNVPILRRRGGGCAVLLDPGNAIVSAALPAPGIGGITSAFAAITAWLIDALARAGVAGVERRGTSDLAIGDRKIGGACIWRTRGLLYYSTTLLVAPRLELVERYLPHPPREPAWRRGRAHREFMGSLAAMGLAADARELAARLDVRWTNPWPPTTLPA